MLSDPEDYLEENETLDMNLQGDQKVWLVKLPKYLMDDWSNPDSMNGQQLGNVKIKRTHGVNYRLNCYWTTRTTRYQKSMISKC